MSISCIFNCQLKLHKPREFSDNQIKNIITMINSISMRNFKTRDGRQKNIMVKNTDGLLLESVKFLSQSISKLSEKIQQMASSNKQTKNMPYVDERFQDIDIQVPMFPSYLEQQQLQEKILKFLGMICKKVFSVGFSLLRNERLDDKKIKVFCSEKLLLLIVQLIKINDLEVKQIDVIDTCLKKRLLPYFQAKYPLSEQGANVSFSSFVISKDNINDEQNDLVFRSGIQFKLSAFKNYNSEIMQFLNYIIDKTKQKKQFFQNSMEKIFALIFLKNQTMKMQQFNPHSPQKYQQKQTNIKTEFQIQYQQKIKSFTSYQIGAKLPDHIKKFNERDIQSGNLDISDPALMRIVTKWCQELEKCYDKKTFLQREKPFRMRDNNIKFMEKKWMIQLLSALLQKAYRQFPCQYVSKVKNHCRQAHMKFATQNIPKQMGIYSEEEATVGKFSSIMFQYCQSYLKGYLNSLIHGIMVALEQFQRIISYKVDFQQEIKEFEETKSQSALLQLIQRSKGYQCYKTTVDDIIPSLITFKIGDIFRCKCSSKQQEIKALYCEIEKRSYFHPEELKIVRIKNRMEKGTKDILINMLYNNQVLVQMQLAIKSDKSKFIESSNSFCHFLYELQRAKFGPINQMCSIWVGKDARSKFFMNILDKNNKRNLTKQKRRCIVVSKKILNLPFVCDHCSFHYFDNQQFERNFEYQYKDKRKQKICFLCHFQTLTIQQKRKQLNIPESLYKGEELQFIFDNVKCSESKIRQVPFDSWIVNLKQINKKPVRVIKYEDPQKILILTQPKPEKYRLLTQLSKNINTQIEFSASNYKKAKTLFMDNIIIKLKNVKEKKNSKICQQIRKKYILPEYLKKCIKAEKNTFSLVRLGISDGNQVFALDQKKKPCNFVKKLNMSENKLSDISIILKKFPEVVELILNFNNFQELDENIGKEGKKLKYFFLSNNKLKRLPQSFQQITSLTSLNLTENRLSQLPKSFGDFGLLTDLNLSNNDLTQLPPSFGKLNSLARVNFDQNKLSHLPEQFSQLTSLEYLKMSYNKLSELPESFGNLKSLNFFEIQSNQLHQLPQSFGELDSLKTLRLSFNKLSHLPKSFGQMSKLTVLHLAYNKLSELPESFSRLSSLTSLFIYSNQISHLPQSFSNLSSLKLLKMSNNKVSELPASFGNLRNLTTLFIGRNQLVSLPASFGGLSSLQILNIQQNQLCKMPESFGNLSSLKELIVKSNRLIELPDSFYKISLSCLAFSPQCLSTDILQKIREKQKSWKLKENDEQFDEED